MYKVELHVSHAPEEGESTSHLPGTKLTGLLPFVPIEDIWLEAKDGDGNYSYVSIGHVAWRMEREGGYFDVSATAPEESSVPPEYLRSAFAYQGWKVEEGER